MRVLEVYWSRALSLMCEATLSLSYMLFSIPAKVATYIKVDACYLDPLLSIPISRRHNITPLTSVISLPLLYLETPRERMCSLQIFLFIVTFHEV